MNAARLRQLCHVRQVTVHLPSRLIPQVLITFGRGGLISDGDWHTYHATFASTQRLMRTLNSHTARLRILSAGSAAFTIDEPPYSERKRQRAAHARH